MLRPPCLHTSNAAAFGLHGQRSRHKTMAVVQPNESVELSPAAQSIGVRRARPRPSRSPRRSPIKSSPPFFYRRQAHRMCKTAGHSTTSAVPQRPWARTPHRLHATPQPILPPPPNPRNSPRHTPQGADDAQPQHPSRTPSFHVRLRLRGGLPGCCLPPHTHTVAAPAIKPCAPLAPQAPLCVLPPPRR